MNLIHLCIGENDVIRSFESIEPQVDSNIIVQALMTHKHSHVIANYDLLPGLGLTND